MTHPNATLMRGFLAAAMKGDYDTVKQYYAEDVVVHFPGRSQLAGDYNGREALFGDFAGKVARLSDKFEIVEVLDVLASDTQALALMSERFERNGESLDIVRAGLYRLEDSKIKEVWIFDSDQYAVDAFFA
jgi:ketosteroid isomerase-like protein